MSANPNIVWIDPDTCEKCMICVEVFGCPAIQRGAGNLVPWIHAELCNGNGSCIQVCPVGAIKRPSGARFGVRPEAADDGGAAPAATSSGEGYKGGPTTGTKTDFAGPGSEKCK
ncbi:MAG: 4Fe-4S binding protein [bacterium]|nr:4Fe-4S binding protein [bacterium]